MKDLRDMAEDRGGKRKGVNGGRGGQVHLAGQFGETRHRRRIVGHTLEREHKRNLRRQAATASRGGLWGWDSLSPMAQHEFTTHIACPRIAYLNGTEPPPLELARLAPITWRDLGIPFNMAFKQQHERIIARQWGIKSDVDLFPERDGNDPANDPCPNCEHMVCACL